MAHVMERYTLDTLISSIEKPNWAACIKIKEENQELFKTAPGSSHNHQAWPGGYHDHVEEVMNIGVYLYDMLHLLRPLPFSVSDAMLVLFLHDIEKLWRFELGPDGRLQNRPGLDTKEQREAFRLQKLAEYGIELTPTQANALKYVEGEYKDYTNKQRVMNELAAFCHMCDVWSARGWYDYPAESSDPWRGAKRAAQ